MALLVLGFSATSANAGKTRLLQGEFGSVEQPGFEEPDALVVDQGTGDLLVVDSDAQTLTRYHEDGTPSDFSVLGTNVIDAKGGGQCPTVPADCDQVPENGFAFNGFTLVTQVAVDESGGITDGNIYVTQSTKGLVDIFDDSGRYLGQLTATGATAMGACGVATDAMGSVLVGEWNPGHEIHKFVPLANPPANSDHVISFPVGNGPFEGGPCNLAVGEGPSSGSIFANIALEGVVRLNGDTGALLSFVATGPHAAIAVNPLSGNVLASEGFGPVKEYNASGSFVASFGAGEGLAVHGAGSRVYVASANKINVYGPLVPIPDVVTGDSESLGLTSARVKGTVNPDGAPVDECILKYGTTTAYGQTAPCAETPGEIGGGVVPKAVHADLAGLAQETRYHYRLVAKNANGTVQGDDRTFKTPSKPTLVSSWVSNVIFTDATLKAKINPEDSETSYRFEWGPDASYGNESPERSAGSDASDHTVSFLLDDLSPGTTYHWRVVAENDLGVVEGPDLTFTTYRRPVLETRCENQALRTGFAAKLPDCRAYELVSPLEKNNADVLTQLTISGYPTAVNQSSRSGERFTYSSGIAFGDPASAPFVSQYIADRDPVAGWASVALAPPQTRAVIDPSIDNEYKFFSADLCSGWLQTEFDPPAAPGGILGFRNLYRRESCAGTGFEALSTIQSPHLTPAGYGIRPQGASADGTRSIFVTNDNLPGTGAPSNLDKRLQLYEHSKEGLRFVCVLPSGNASQQECSAGTADEDLGATGTEQIPNYSHAGSFQNAISANGDRIFWTESFQPGPGRIFVRFAGQLKSERVSQSVSGAKARFWGAAADGSKAIFSFEDAESAQSGNLYSFDVGADKSTLIAGNVDGVLGIAEDALRVYFVSREAIAGAGENSEHDQAAAGEPNLYIFEDGLGGDSYSFVARLPPTGARLSSIATSPFLRTSRVTPDGRHAAFMSSAPLTGYDNTDAVSDKADAEVFLYRADDRRLSCVSCNPSGARPTGVDVAANDIILGGAGAQIWTAAQIPTWETPFYASRVLSDDGRRLFFESFEALVPQDTNGVQDVYQWEAQGSGDCEAGNGSFGVESGGCVTLISSGESPRESSFVDASPSGDDIFIATLSSLVPPDYGLVDIYDARVGGGIAYPQAKAPCEGDACQSPPASPADPTLASSSFRGAGNVKHPSRCPKGKRRVKRNGKQRCVKKHSKQRASRGDRKKAAR